MTLYILTVRVISSYSVHERVVHFIENTETCYFVFRKKEKEICYRTTEPLWKIIITNMQS